MAQKGLTGFFEQFLAKKSIFKNKKALQPNYTPETIFHRDEQIKQIANILAPSLRLEKPSNLFMYGQTGTGKTLSTQYTTNQLLETATQKALPLKIIYINCKLKKATDTEYRLIAQLARYFGKEIPSTGLPTEEVYSIFFNVIDKEKLILILILDEIDQLVKKTGDEMLYNLTRINSELKNSQISIIGISNDSHFTDNLDPRVKSSLSEEEILFPPYNAIQIKEILKQRADIAFSENALEDGVIEKCSAYAAREHGDVRRAIELLRVAAEISERNETSSVKMEHLDMAEEKIEHDKVLDIITTQPKQFQVTLYAIITLYTKRKDMLFTGEIYELYKGYCLQTGLRPLTQRRVSDIISEMDTLGLINAQVISKGRYGRTRKITMQPLPSPLPKLKRLLEEQLDLV